MAITKASSSAVAPAAKGDLVVGNATNDSGVLAVGSTDQVLTVDSSTATGLKWATASAGAWTQSATGSFSGASLTISSLSAKKYFIILDGVSHNDTGTNRDVRLRLNGDTGNNYAANYETSKDNYLVMTGTLGAASVAYASYLIDLCDTASQYKPVYMANRQGVTTGGNYISTSTITSITFFVNGGSFDAGTYYVWSFA